MTYLPCPGREAAAARRPFERYKLPCALAIFLVLLALAPGLTAQSLELTSAQRQWLAAHKVVRVAPDPDLTPIDGIDADGRQRGLSADYLKLIAARTGLEFRVVRVTSRERGAARAGRTSRRPDVGRGARRRRQAEHIVYRASTCACPLPYSRVAANPDSAVSTNSGAIRSPWSHRHRGRPARRAGQSRQKRAVCPDIARGA